MEPIHAESSRPAHRRSGRHSLPHALAGLLAAILFIPFAGKAFAEDRSPLQIGLFPPVQLVPESYDIYGLKLNLFIGRCRNLTGIDLGVAGEVTDEVNGLQLALVGSQASRLNGLQISGLLAGFNQAGEIRGVQLGWGLFGGSNEANRMTGLQLAAGIGIGWNDSKGPMHGLQLGAALFGANLAGEVDGLQITTLFNKARDLRGVQIGLVNYCENLHGIQIGALNLARHAPLPILPLVNAWF